MDILTSPILFSHCTESLYNMIMTAQINELVEVANTKSQREEEVAKPVSLQTCFLVLRTFTSCTFYLNTVG